MSSPKRTRILDAIVARVSVISRAAGYYTDIGADVRTDQREPDYSEAPLALVVQGDRQIAQTKNRRSLCTQELIVIGYAKITATDTSEALGNQILADIQRAVELEDETLGGLLKDGLTPQLESIELPESGANIVAASIVYAAPTIRVTGDPEIN